MTNTSARGNESAGVILAALLRSGRQVLLPFGDGSPYDLAYDDDGKLVRVECKTGWCTDGCVIFNVASSQRDTKVRTSYRGRADIFGVYCPELNEVYFVPVEDVGENCARLRITPTKNNQAAGVRWAEDYRWVA